jgi:hypothetical protein
VTAFEPNITLSRISSAMLTREMLIGADAL